MLAAKSRATIGAGASTSANTTRCLRLSGGVVYRQLKVPGGGGGKAFRRIISFSFEEQMFFVSLSKKGRSWSATNIQPSKFNH